MAGLAASLGSGAMTNSIGEIVDAACILAIGTNTTVAHPIIALRVKEAVRRGAKLIVANPKEIDLCRDAALFMQLRPGTDVALLMGMMRIIVNQGLLNKAFIEERCENFDEFAKSLEAFDLDFVETTTGVSKETIFEAARLYAMSSPASILYTMGITQHTHGTDNVLAVSNLALLTGNIGKPSSGVNPLRGQNNVQGACDMGGLPNVSTGYQRVDNPDVQKKFENAWGTTLPNKPGLTLTEMFNGALDGRVKAMYLVGENPVLSDADITHVEEAIRRLEFLVVQDIFLTETAMMADVVLPAACFAEKDGTVTNTERRVQLGRKAVEPPGQARADWQIVCDLAKKMGAAGFDFNSATEVFEEISTLTPSYGGISYERLEQGGIQWPCPDAAHPGTPTLHTVKFATPSGKGKLTPLTYRPSAETPDDEYPYILTTDRSLFHYHTATMTGRVEGLKKLRSHELLLISPADAALMQVSSGDLVQVTSRRGKVTAEVCLDETCPKGVVSMTFHFGDCRTNLLTNPAVDPVAKIPETKVCTVKIEKG